MGHVVNVGAVFKALVEDDVHHAEGEGGVGTGADGDVPVGERGGAGAIGIDDDETCAVAAGLVDHGPEVDVVAVDVRGPGKDEFGEAEVFGGDSELFSVDEVPGLAAGLRTDGAVEAAGAEAVEEAAVHGAEAEHADGACVAVGQDGLGTVLRRLICWRRAAIAVRASSQVTRSKASCSRPLRRGCFATPGLRRSGYRMRSGA